MISSRRRKRARPTGIGWTFTMQRTLRLLMTSHGHHGWFRSRKNWTTTNRKIAPSLLPEQYKPPHVTTNMHLYANMVFDLFTLCLHCVIKLCCSCILPDVNKESHDSGYIFGSAITYSCIPPYSADLNNTDMDRQCIGVDLWDDAVQPACHKSIIDHLSIYQRYLRPLPLSACQAITNNQASIRTLTYGPALRGDNVAIVGTELTVTCAAGYVTFHAQHNATTFNCTASDLWMPSGGIPICTRS